MLGHVVSLGDCFYGSECCFHLHLFPLFPAPGVNFYFFAWVHYCTDAYSAVFLNPNPASHWHFSF